jgi:hypothetical protein
MHGNYPYVGGDGPSIEPAAGDGTELSAEQREQLQQGLSGIVSRTRTFLPDGYAVDARLSVGEAGVRAAVAVDPPVGHSVSAEFDPDTAALDPENALDETDYDDVALNLAASAALQAKRAEAEPPQTAR